MANIERLREMEQTIEEIKNILSNMEEDYKQALRNGQGYVEMNEKYLLSQVLKELNAYYEHYKRMNRVFDEMDRTILCCGCNKYKRIKKDEFIHCLKCKNWFCSGCFTEFNDEGWSSEEFREEVDKSPRGKYGEIEYTGNSCDSCNWGDPNDYVRFEGLP